MFLGDLKYNGWKLQKQLKTKKHLKFKIVDFLLRLKCYFAGILPASTMETFCNNYMKYEMYYHEWGVR